MLRRRLHKNTCFRGAASDVILKASPTLLEVFTEFTDHHVDLSHTQLDDFFYRLDMEELFQIVEELTLSGIPVIWPEKRSAKSPLRNILVSMLTTNLYNTTYWNRYYK